MGQGVLSWGFAGFFILPVILILLVFLTPKCSNRDVAELAEPPGKVDTVQMMQSEEN